MTDRERKLELLSLLEERDKRRRSKRLFFMYPEEGQLSRFNYPKHMAFFRAGLAYRERCFMAANRVGKTEGVTGFELTCHATGKYPDWWEGRRFAHPIRAWAAGTTAETTRDIVQRKLMGPLTEVGTGLIPAESIVDFKRDTGIPDAVNTVTVRHATGGNSIIGFKAYKQGRKSFEGDEQDVIMLDEEPPLDIYTECVIRTMTTNGLIMLGFTPLEGISETVLMFLPGGQPADPQVTGKYTVSATWDDAPHLSDKDKAELWASLPPHQRDARSRGIPSIGSGAIYPIDEAFIMVDDFPIQDYWPRAYGMDVGWNWTAGVFGAWDQQNDILYIYAEYKRGMAEPVVHTSALKLRGADWMTGVIDPSSNNANQKDGSRLLDEYVMGGLDLYKAENAVEAGLFAVWQRMSSGRLKVFKSCVEWLGEFRIYRRDEHGKVVKQYDHLMDCTRYLVMSGRTFAKTPPEEKMMENWRLKDRGDYEPLRAGMG